MSSTGAPDSEVILSIESLQVAYQVRGHERKVLKDLDLRISRRQAYGLVGESGSGKSTAAFAAVRYLPRAGRVVHGRITFEGRDLMALSAVELRAVRTHGISMVYQDPSRALNPTLRIGRQMTEIFELSERPSAPANRRAAEMLARVRIGDPQRVLQSYPHEISGGMQQRVVIAMALSSNPSLLVLDEPTTGLDATVEAEVLDLIAGLRTQLSTAILFISHSLPVIARMCDTVGVLYAGQLIEEGPAGEVLARPRHPYTVALLRCAPRFGQRKSEGRLSTIPGFQPGDTLARGCLFAERCAIATDMCRNELPPRADLNGRWSRCHYPERASELGNVEEQPAPSGASVAAHARPLLKVRALSKTYSGSGTRAVDGIDLDLWPGETLGLVGESGSGKSSLGKLLLGLVPPDAGSLIEFDGAALAGRVNRRTPAQIKALQIIFQNPGSALNASHSVRRLIGRALRMIGLRGAGREARLRTLATAVRLSAAHLAEKPRALSGGLKQRVAIARAFAGEPKIVVCDEPTSALDLSVQASILNLLVRLQAEQHVSYIFISHDLAVVHYLADRIAVLYSGRLLEIGPAAQVFAGPHHPYTETLLGAAAPKGATPVHPTAGAEPSTRAPQTAGCVFQNLCPRTIGPLCETQAPPFRDAGAGHRIRCHIAVEELRTLQCGASGEMGLL